MVAERKVEGLLHCSACVTVVSPTLTPKLERYAIRGELVHFARAYKTEDLEGNLLVFAATNDSSTNNQIVHEARKRGILVNSASSAQLSTFSCPSVLRRGDIVITASTSGKAPWVAKKVKEEIDKSLGVEYELMANIIGEVRRLYPPGHSKRRDAIRRITRSRLLELLREGEFDRAEEELAKTTGLTLKDLGIRVR
jgi:precorrin-2 dehydrogenase/sirohydrochlorin ferrochelatase